jgi:hypothetical protein
MLGWNMSVSRRFNSQIVRNRSTAVRKTILDDPILPAPPRPHSIVTYLNHPIRRVIIFWEIREVGSPEWPPETRVLNWC